MIVFDERAAAEGEFIDHTGKICGRCSERFNGGHENRSAFHAAKFTNPGAAETGAGIVVIHYVRKFKGHEADTGLETRISEKHI